MPRGTGTATAVSKRDALLEAGKEVLFERGLASATIDEITSRAGVAKGTFYLYFSGKDDLVKGLREGLWQEMMTLAVEGLQRAEGSDPWAVIDWLLEAIVDFDLRHADWHRFLAGGFHDPLLEDQVLEQQFLDLGTALVESGVEQGAFRVEDPVYAVLLVYRGIEGTLHQLCSRGQDVDRDRLLAAIRTLVHRALGDPA